MEHTSFTKILQIRPLFFYAARHMKSGITRATAFAALTILLAGCAGRQLPEYEPPLKRSQFMKVRTTAYTDTESDHIRYQNSSAAGTALQNGSVRSAAADWARWPLGTRFLILATGQEYEVDDYGWAISGRNTIDLYCPNFGEMNDWGVRRVTIQILEWGSTKHSYAVLSPRRNYAHVRRMLDEIRRFE
jgi:3D (Asp-Asp-Asp) domain-containing protein